MQDASLDATDSLDERIARRRAGRLHRRMRIAGPFLALPAILLLLILSIGLIEYQPAKRSERPSAPTLPAAPPADAPAAGSTASPDGVAGAERGVSSVSVVSSVMPDWQMGPTGDPGR
jgi:hypothetical protein